MALEQSYSSAFLLQQALKELNVDREYVACEEKKVKHGEQYYWILYYTYLCPQQLQNIEEICKIRNLSEPTLNFSILPVLFIIP